MEASCTNRYDGVTGSDRDDVGAGNDVAPAGVVDGGLDAVDHLEAAGRVHVRRRVLLAGEEGRVVQQDGPVAPLNDYTLLIKSTNSFSVYHIVHT
jgi:hypothetical protein